MNLIKYRNLFFALSLTIIIPGIVAFYLWGLRLGIDFAGGTLWELKFANSSASEKVGEIRNVLTNEGAEISSVSSTSQNTITVRMKVTDEEKITFLKNKVNDSISQTEDIRLDIVGPTISKELTRNAFLAVAISILGIMTYVTWAFRKVPRPASSIAFGLCTVLALVHDVVVVVGTFAILGHFFAVEIDSLFITALLTVLGFSVHDTIVVFDRIRENLNKHDDLSFSEVVNYSIVQTLGRSLNTSLTVVFVLLALLIFGGQSIKTFVLALLVGVISGTYSSIFNAAPLLVVWHNLRKGKRT